jgi:hypothetical protein
LAQTTAGMPSIVTVTGPSSPLNEPSVVTVVWLPHSLHGFKPFVMRPSSDDLHERAPIRG